MYVAQAMNGYSTELREDERAGYSPPAPLFAEGEETEAMKLRFAEVLARNPANPYIAARMIVADPRRAAFVAANWPYDPAVVLHMDRQAAEGVEKCLPTKAELAHTILQKADAVVSKDTALDYFKLAANILGYTQAPGGTNVNVNQQNNVATVVHKVMEVPAFASVEEADLAIAAQQARLVNATS